jgi:hypothetical protein
LNGLGFPEPVLAVVAWRPDMVLTVTAAIDHAIPAFTTRLAANAGGAIRQKLDIAGKHQLYGLINAAVGVGQGGAGFGGHLGETAAPQGTEVFMVEGGA